MCKSREHFISHRGEALYGDSGMGEVDGGGAAARQSSPREEYDLPGEYPRLPPPPPPPPPSCSSACCIPADARLLERPADRVRDPLPARYPPPPAPASPGVPSQHPSSSKTPRLACCCAGPGSARTALRPARAVAPPAVAHLAIDHLLAVLARLGPGIELLLVGLRRPRAA